MIVTLIIIIFLISSSAQQQQGQEAELGGGPIIETKPEIKIEEVIEEIEVEKFEKVPKLVEDPDPEPVLPYAHSVVVIDMDSGKILFAKEERKKMPIASLTKVMTAIIVEEKITDWDEEVWISKKAAFSGGAGVSLKWDERIQADKLFKAMVMNSDNAAAIALAEHISGSTEEFAKLMNEKARDLGALDTKFVEPSGLEDEVSHSTAYDIALITQYAAKKKKTCDTMRIKGPIEVASSDGILVHRVGNTNQFLRDENFQHLANRIEMGKTGFTYNAGYCLMTAMEDKKGKRKAIGVILNSAKKTRWYEMENIIEWSFDNYTW
ncbi:MAG: hypothetical protein GF335_04125 [Candidatus Moranbacteria bacterium]|nr:hypothetical protein [Candidatus Moranbacteria bacterium]